MKKVCWISYRKDRGVWVLFTQEDEEMPGKCEYAFDSYPTATPYKGTRGEAVDKNLLYAINDFIESGYIFIGII